MKTTELRANLSRYISVSLEETEVFLRFLKPKKIKNRKFLLTQGTVCAHFSLVVSGCVMNYYQDKSKNIHVLQFATKMWWTADLNSYIHATPSEYFLRATTDTIVYQLSRAAMDELVTEMPKFERYFRIIFQNSLIAHQKRIIENISETAECRYMLFREKYPEVEQLVSQKYIASYLGITPEFLSKIRRNLAERPHS